MKSDWNKWCPVKNEWEVVEAEEVFEIALYS